MGTVRLSASLVDLNENRATEPLIGADFSIDTVPPPPVDTSGDRVRLSLAPWGMAPNPGTGAATLWADDGTVRESQWVRVLEGSREVVRAPVSADGGFGPLSLPLSVSSALELVAVDSAGNSSAASSVRDVVWTASLGQKLAGSTSENPHRLQVVGAMGPGVLRADVIEQGASDGVDAKGGLYASVQGASSWAWKSNAVPRGNYFRQYSWDVGRARWVSFEHANVPGTLRVAEWSGDDWFVVEPRLSEGPELPSARNGAAVAYDEFGQVTVIFGGKAPGSTFLSDTWHWNGRSFRRVGGAGPSPRSESALFYEPSMNGVVLFGGRAPDAGLLNDTWLLRSGTWQALNSGAPAGRFEGAATYDAVRGNTLLLGGTTPTAAAAKDAWRFVSGTWVRDPDFDLPPQGGVRASMLAVDPATGQAFFTHQGIDGVWGSTDAGWTKLFSTTAPPDAGAPLHPYGLSFDRARGQLLLQSSFGDTWAWSKGALKKVASDVGGITRHYHEIAFSPDGPAPLMGLGSGSRFWTWDGDSFFESSPPFSVVAPVPSAECRYRGAFPSAVRICTNYQGNFVVQRLDTRHIDAGYTTSTELAWPADAGPAVGGWVSLAAVVADQPWILHPSMQRFMQFTDGGWALGPPMPSPIFSWALNEMPPDITSATVGLTDGGALAFSLQGTAVWTGGQFQMSASPRLRYPSVTWNEARRRYLAVGAEYTDTEPRIATELTPQGWKTMPLSDPEGDGDTVPTRLLGGVYVVAYDSLTQGVFANIPRDGPMVQRAATHRPGALFRVELRANTQVFKTLPNTLSGRVVARASSQRDGGASAGLTLWLWKLGRWTAVDGVTASDDGTTGFSSLAFTIDDAQAVRTLLLGQPELVLAVTPDGVNGTDWATLDVDYVDVSLGWRESDGGL